MNYIDVIIIIVGLTGFFIGWKMRGVLVVIIPVGFIAGIIAANYLYHPLSTILTPLLKDSSKRVLISYTVVFAIACGIIISLGFAISGVFDFFNMAFVDRIFGAAILITILAIPLYLLFQKLGGLKGFQLRADLEKSVIFPYMRNYVEFIFRIPFFNHFSVLNKIIG
jgi:uncharacterized membrane protein required for colicin V production